MYSFTLQDDEQIIKKGHASLHVPQNAFTGAFYLTTERLVFVGYVMDITKKYVEEVMLANIRDIQGGNTFFVIPNTLVITTVEGECVKIIVDPGERKGWLAAIKEQMQKSRHTAL